MRHLTDAEIGALSLQKLAIIVNGTNGAGEFAREVAVADRTLNHRVRTQPTDALHRLHNEVAIYSDEGNDFLCDLITEELSLRETEAWNAL